MVQSLGINITKYFCCLYGGAGMAALGGVLVLTYSGMIHAGTEIEFGILAFIVVVIGGMGSFPGSILAAILVGLSGSFMAYYVPI